LQTSSDRYVIAEYLAEGGMGAIYLGKKLGVGGFEKDVVLKQLLPEFTREPKFIDLFLREARLSASLEHANIVRTIDLVNAGTDYFMVMEYVRGADLRTLLRRVRRRHRRFGPEAGVFIGHEILEALCYAHQKTAHDGRPLNLCHRDISPSNILLSGAGEVKLTDFGIAKASTHRSVFYKVKGKVGYMSPEQARGEPVDARSDLFSLGVVMYEVLVGERLFVGDLMSTASQIYAQPIKPPSQKRPEIPPDLDAVILKSLALDPNSRFQSAEEFQQTLTRVATRHRLVIGVSEMAAQLAEIAGADASMWLKLTDLVERSESTQSHGTDVLSGAEADEMRAGLAAHQADSARFDFSEERDEDDGEMPNLLARSRRPPSLPTGELTSMISTGRQAPEANLPDGAPSAPINSAHDVSRAQTVVRGSGRGPAPTMHEEATKLHESGQFKDGPTGLVPTATQTGSAGHHLARNPRPGVPARPRGPSPRRGRGLIAVGIALLIIGIGVALGVAFSGPEVEVDDSSPASAPR
jgi:serine/threonine protein kinase